MADINKQQRVLQVHYQKTIKFILINYTTGIGINMLKQKFCKLFGHFPETTVVSIPIEILWKYEIKTTIMCSCCKQILSQTSKLSNYSSV